MAGFSIDRKTLYEEIWASSVMKVAEKYEISYSRLLSACKQYNIPVPPSGYNTKREFGKPVETIPLPESEEIIITIESPPKKKEVVKLNPETSSNGSEDTDSLSVETIGDVSADEENDQDKVPLLRYMDPQEQYREKLYQQVWEKPVSSVAKDEGVSDNAVRKWCINLNIPLPERGYWAKLKAGQKVHKTKLPRQDTHFPKPSTGEKCKLHIDVDALSFMKKDDRLEIIELASILRVSGPGSKLLPVVKKLQEEYQKWAHPKRQYSPGGYAITPWHNPKDAPLLANTISDKLSSRCFHILDALMKALLPYMGDIDYEQPNNSKKTYYFKVNGDRVPFTITEGKENYIHEVTQAERIQMLQYEEARRKGSYAEKPKVPKYDHPWNGKLKISIADTFIFEDCKSYLLEDRIGEILIALYEASYSVRLKRLEREEWERQAREEERKREQIRKNYDMEVEKTQALVNKANDYEIACRIRRYIDAVRNNPDAADNNPDWLDWASKKADWYDPTIARVDDFFGEREHGKDPDRKKLQARWLSSFY